jgi:RNA polymerase-binding transcription factor DksA
VEPHRDVIDRATATLDDVDRALRRLAESTYRSCENCGAPLVEKRLAADPTLRRCADHLGDE